MPFKSYLTRPDLARKERAPTTTSQRIDLSLEGARMKHKFGELVSHTTLPERPGFNQLNPGPSHPRHHAMTNIKKAKILIETKRNI